VPEVVLHLWHGDLARRRYVERNFDLKELGFNPDTDLRIGPSGTWEWNGPRADSLRQWAKAYFAHRREDG
jgi:hypothetical protein